MSFFTSLFKKTEQLENLLIFRFLIETMSLYSNLHILLYYWI